jgi:hypothetical protein
MPSLFPSAPFSKNVSGLNTFRALDDALLLFEGVQLFQPPHERVRRSVRLFFILCAFHFVEDLVALIDAGSGLLLARKALRVFEMADDPTVPEMQLRREMELDRHAAETAGCGKGSGGNAPS